MTPEQFGQQMDQAIAFFRNDYPKMLHSLYLGCVEEGFTEAQSMEIVRFYIQKPDISDLGDKE